MKIEIEGGYVVDYFEQFYHRHEADELLRHFLALNMSLETVRLRGRDHVPGRLSAQLGRPYRYNPCAKEPEPWTQLMLGIRRRIEDVAGPLDGALVQIYPTGAIGIGWHHDEEDPEMIASLSLGAERRFFFGVPNGSSCRRVEWRDEPLAHGSLLLIPATTNQALKHQLPAAKRIKEPRVNITLRRFPSAPPVDALTASAIR